MVYSHFLWERFPSLGNENHPMYSPAPRDIKEPKTSVIDDKQPRKKSWGLE